MNKQKTPVRNLLFRYAAWYSLIAPLIAGGITFLVDHFNIGGLYDFEYGRTHAHSFPVHDSVEDVAFLICFSSFMLGVSSLSGIRDSGAKTILWKAVPGILLSGVFAATTFFMIVIRGSRQ